MPRLPLIALLALAPLVLPGRAPAAQQGGEPAWTQVELETLAKRIQGEIEELRGQRFREDVAVKVADRDTLVEYMKRRTEEDEPPEKLAADERIAKLLALIPPDMDLLAESYSLIESQVAGFYDPPANTFFLMESMPKAIAGPILAHELIHALDDQYYDLDAAMKALGDETDAMQAYRFLVEGSGTSGGNLWTMQHIDGIDMSGLQGLMDEQQAALVSSPPFLWKPLLGAYLQGAAFLARAGTMLEGQTKAADLADIRAAFGDVPRSTEQVLHPEKYWEPARRDEPRPVGFTLEELPRGWSELRRDTLGELGLALLTGPRGASQVDMSNPMSILGLRFTNHAAEGWGGDRLILLGSEGAAWLRLVSVWDSERDAGEFYGALVGLQPTLEEAAAALAGDGSSGVEVAYGEGRDEVVLTIWSGVSRRHRRALDKAVGYTLGEAGPASER